MNIQIIDGALNCTYDIYQIKDEDFAVIFPASGQDIEFAEDLAQRMGNEAHAFLKRLWARRLEKAEVFGIHGTLFFGLTEKRIFYPTKKESEMTNGL